MRNTMQTARVIYEMISQVDNTEHTVIEPTARFTEKHDDWVMSTAHALINGLTYDESMSGMFNDFADRHYRERNDINTMIDFASTKDIRFNESTKSPAKFVRARFYHGFVYVAFATTTRFYVVLAVTRGTGDELTCSEAHVFTIHNGIGLFEVMIMCTNYECCAINYQPWYVLGTRPDQFTDELGYDIDFDLSLVTGETADGVVSICPACGVGELDIALVTA